MKHESKRKVVTVEEHLITFNRDELADLLRSALPEDTEIDPRSINLCAIVGDDAENVIGPSDLRKIARSQVEEIPEDAEVVLSIRWRKEVEGIAHPAPAPAAYAPAAAPVAPPADGEMVASGAPCATCGSVPDLHGPTPDCEDAVGCGRVRRLKGEMPVPKSAPAQSAAHVPGTGGPAGQDGPGTHYLVNRDTGEQVFADQMGGAYGHHEDYTQH